MLWSVFGCAQAALAGRGLLTRAGLFTKLAAAMAGLKNPAFEFAVVDVGAGQRPNALFPAGDLGQRIYQAQFSWLALGWMSAAAAARCG